jgi:hypothetical protein
MQRRQRQETVEYKGRAKTPAECTDEERALLSQLYDLSNIRSIWWPSESASSRTKLVATDLRIEPVVLLFPSPEDPKEEVRIYRLGHQGIDVVNLASIRLSTRPRVGFWETPRRFFQVSVQLVCHDDTVGYEHHVGIYEEGGFVARDHQLLSEDGRGSQFPRIHPEEKIRSEAEHLVRWIEDHR